TYSKGEPVLAATDETLTIAPGYFALCTNSREHRKQLVTLVVSTLLKRSTLISDSGDWQNNTPALFTRCVTGPKRCSAASNSARTSLSTETSAWQAKARPPVALMAATTASAL